MYIVHELQFMQSVWHKVICLIHFHMIKKTSFQLSVWDWKYYSKMAHNVLWSRTEAASPSHPPLSSKAVSKSFIVAFFLFCKPRYENPLPFIFFYSFRSSSIPSLFFCHAIITRHNFFFSSSCSWVLPPFLLFLFLIFNLTVKCNICLLRLLLDLFY